MKYRLPAEKHDHLICQEIGQAAGQVAGGWSIGHENDGGFVVLTLPDGLLTKAQVDAIAASHPKPPPKPPPDHLDALEARVKKLEEKP